MKHDWEKQIKDGILAEVSSVPFSETEENRILDAVHQEIGERSKIMKLSKKKMGIVLAAAMILVGTVTAAAAGKISYLKSGVSLNDVVTEAGQLLGQAEKKLGQKPKMAEALGDGLQFSDGHVTDVDAIDDEGNRVDSYPEVFVHYQGDQDVTLSVSRPLENLPRAEEEYTLEETYQDILLQGKVDQYLFLPPSQEPSEEDKKLEEEGRLMISYGSETEQRKAFKSIAWNEDGLHYLLFSFDEIGLEELAGYAKEIIDME